jgi:hypothetical protein
VPIPRSADWLALDERGWIGRLSSGESGNDGTWDVLARSSLPGEGGRARRRLHVSPDGRFAAVVNDFGRHGQVVDLGTGRVTMDLDGGRHCHDVVPFSLAFVEAAGRTLVVHRTDANRLEVADPAGGEPVTVPPAVRRPDYFHGGLHVSPGGRRIADDGWMWSPVGVPRVWDVRAWLRGDAGSISLCERWYRWNAPICWLDDHRLVVSGIGDDDEAMLAGVRIFHASRGIELTAFAGPSGELFADAARLYAAAPGGLEVWDPVTGHRTASIPGFVPSHRHPGTGELAAIDGDRLLRWHPRLSPRQTIKTEEKSTRRDV